MYKKIDEEIDFGSIEGYSVSYNDENYKIFLDENLNDKVYLSKIIDFIKLNKFENIKIIKNLNVEDEYRGQGIGSDLLNSETNSADIVLLISDKYESQIKGFLLDKFYEAAGFHKLTETGSGALMCYPASVAIKIEENLLNNKKHKNKIS